MADQDGYNGWTNYETWCVNLWLSNDEGLYNEVRDTALAIIESKAPWNEVDRGHATYSVSIWLAEFVEDLAEHTCPGVTSGASFVVDLFRGTLSEVNWDEIATSWVDDLIGVDV